MNLELVQLIGSGGAGVATIVITVVFLRFLRAEREQLMEDRIEERREFLERLEQISTSVAELNTALSDRPCLLKKDR